MPKSINVEVFNDTKKKCKTNVKLINSQYKYSGFYLPSLFLRYLPGDIWYCFLKALQK